jgi:H/ACA ribonucleoprotein complex subunit 4
MSHQPIEALLECCFINIDKPPGPTSHQVSEMVKKVLGVPKAGHSGTLDPKVTGCLPVGIGRAAKLNYLTLSAGKEYVGIAHFHADVTEADINRAFAKFTGVIMQTPPIMSAVKRQARPRTIYAFETLEIDGRDVLFRAQVEGGTYIRKLVHDVGAYLRIGAHMGDLRRTKAGSFDESSLVILHDLRDALAYWKESGDDTPLRGMLQAPEKAVEHVARIEIDRDAARAVCHGAYLAIPGVLAYSDFAKGESVVMMAQDLLIGYGTALMNSEDLAHLEKGMLIATDAIIRDPKRFA